VPSVIFTEAKQSLYLNLEFGIWPVVTFDDVKGRSLQMR
jgi:hypothetical protein